MRSVWFYLLLGVSLIGGVRPLPGLNRFQKAENIQCPETVEEVQAYQESLSGSFADLNYEGTLGKIVFSDSANLEKTKFDKCIPKITKGKTQVSSSCVLRLRDYIYEIRKMQKLKYEASPSLDIPAEFSTDAFLEKIRKYPPDLKGVFAQIEEMNKARPEKEKLISTYFLSQVGGITSKHNGRLIVIAPGDPSKIIVVSIPDNKPGGPRFESLVKNKTDIGVVSVDFDDRKFARGEKVVTDIKWSDTAFHRGKTPRILYKPGQSINCNDCHQGKLLPIMSAFSRDSFGDGKEEINDWINSLKYRNIVNENNLGPSIGEDRDRSLSEIAACEENNEWELKQFFDTRRGQQSRALVADAMRCSRCHGQGKEVGALKRKNLSDPDFDSFVTNSIDQGWMPSHAKIPLSDYEKSLLKVCLKDEFFGTKEKAGSFTNWFRENRCTNFSPDGVENSNQGTVK